MVLLAVWFVSKKSQMKQNYLYRNYNNIKYKYSKQENNYSKQENNYSKKH